MKNLKRFLALVLTMSITLCTVSSSVSASMESTYRRGDVDGDGDVDNVDSAYLANFLSGIKASANDQMSQRLDVDLSGIIDQHDKTTLSSIIANGTNPVYINYETSNSGVPAQSVSNVYYRKYSAYNGTLVNDVSTPNGQYYLSPVSTISTNSVNEPETTRSGTDYSNLGIVALHYKKNGVSYSGTGFIVDSNKIITAAHCMFNTKFDFPAYDITIDVYENATYTPNTYTAQYYHIPQDYYNATDYDANCDYAIITLNHNFDSDYFMSIGVARDSLKNNTASTVYNNIYDNNGISRLCLYLTGQFLQMWTEEGYFKSIGGNIMTDDVCYYIPMGYSGQSGAPVYVETEEEEKTVFGIGSGGNVDFGLCKRIDTDVLRFVFNNPYV